MAVDREAEKPDQVGGNDAVQVADADDPARELAAAGEFICLGAADAQRAGAFYKCLTSPGKRPDQPVALLEWDR